MQEVTSLSNELFDNPITTWLCIKLLDSAIDQYTCKCDLTSTSYDLISYLVSGIGVAFLEQ